MKTLIIPDIHERYTTLIHEVMPLTVGVDRVVCLGDYFDTFRKKKAAPEMVCWLQDHIDDPKWTFLLGNHDLHYLSGGNYGCSGYNHQTQATITHMCDTAFWRKFALYTTVGPYTVSHAGFVPSTWHFCDPDITRVALDTALRGEYHPIFGAGYARAGREPVGGPLWCDWAYEMIIDPDRPQIVGHTKGEDVRHVKGSWCIDTDLNHVALVNDQGVEIITLARASVAEIP